MKILVLVNRVEELRASQSSCEIAFGLKERDHTVFLGDVTGLSWTKADKPSVWCYRSEAPSEIGDWLNTTRSQSSVSQNVDAFDLIWVRTNPGRDKNRGWAHDVVLDLLEWAEERGVVVLNTPSMLRKASSKMYLQSFPSAIRPRSIISQNKDDVLQFILEEKAPVILKPLRGTGGSGVFIVRPDDLSNFNQIFETLAQNDFVIAQEYLTEGVIGDVRLLLLWGEPIFVDGESAQVARLRQGYDLRSNVAVGGKPAASQFSDDIKNIVDLVSQKLKADRVFLAGLDIIGQKVVEINVFSPGGIRDAGRYAGKDFLQPILVAAEKEVWRRKGEK